MDQADSVAPEALKSDGHAEDVEHISGVKYEKGHLGEYQADPRAGSAEKAETQARERRRRSA